ncbi:MAG: BrnA antitoxin family protein [Alphaproteobacteria bacterium]|nr:BrnA antitoxin family protein [Alphaproteobacteria bacterium]
MDSDRLPAPANDAPDGDNPEWTDADFARARAATAVPELSSVMDVLVRKPGRPAGTRRSDRELVSMRLPRHVIAFFQREGKKGWQTRAIAALERIAMQPDP